MGAEKENGVSPLPPAGAAGTGVPAPLPAWKVKVIVLVVIVLTILNGYDVSNIANIQPAIYEAFGHIEVLPWVGLGYTAGSASTLPICRKLNHLIDMKILMLCMSIIFAVGTIVAATSTSMQAVIVGRIINGIGGGGLTQIVFAYVALTTAPNTSKVVGLVGMAFALGLIAGPLVGGAFADNQHATWRWAIWIVLPFLGATIPPTILAFPSYLERDPSRVAFSSELRRFDWVGSILHAASVILLLLALTFSGPLYAWRSAPAIVLWVVWGVVFAVYITQQVLCVFTTPERRILPVSLLSSRTGALVAICTIGAAMAYSSGLYYLPLFYAFTRGYSPIDSAVRLLPFIAVFIVVVIVTGGLLPAVGFYKLFYLVAGALVLIGGALLATQVSSTTSVGTVMGLSALLGAGIGAMLQHGLSILSAAMPPQMRSDASTVVALGQAGGAALALAIAGCVYQNKGFDLLRDVMAPRGYSDLEIREALAGLKSPVWATTDSQLQALAVQAVTEGLTRVFYVIVAAGSVCTLAAAAMKWEKLAFGKARAPPSKPSETATPDVEQQSA